ncbi:MAG: prepilin-type N-terminal cleavage/methylation domain-containing protein, partial [Desulfobulbaceae bacterium]|nr:prepilin-type N-terminal cleavage/methylation domain-containing protein [Desulfobulbaceae bacterium]
MPINSHYNIASRVNVNNTKAFTLIEVLLASVLGAMIALAGIAAYQTVAQARRNLAFNSEVMAHGRYALNMIRDDLASQYRGKSADDMKLVGIVGEKSNKTLDRLIFHITADDMGNDNDLQGDIYEVEYGLSVNDHDKELYLGRRIAP